MRKTIVCNLSSVILKGHKTSVKSSARTFEDELFWSQEDLAMRGNMR